ncbi:MAG: DALR anticodon-binding domain-containing protein, partial [Nitrospira sp.]|nr:DALR anticodon-binding domain-containing protein [Nitrospira sp.]
PARDRPLDLVDLVMKMKALERVTAKQEFDSLIVGFKRVHRLVEKEQWTSEPVDAAKFQHDAESVLHKAVADQRGKIEDSVKTGEYGLTLDALVSLRPAIDAFFTAVMVNADDTAIRSNRLSLLKDVDHLFMSFADLSQIVVQGG